MLKVYNCTSFWQVDALLEIMAAILDISQSYYFIIISIMLKYYTVLFYLLLYF